MPRFIKTIHGIQDGRMRNHYSRWPSMAETLFYILREQIEIMTFPPTLGKIQIKVFFFSGRTTKGVGRVNPPDH